MPSDIGQESTKVAQQSWELELARKVVSRQTQSPPAVPAQEVAEALLARLLKEKQSRLKRGLDHWDEHAPKVVERMLKQVLIKARRRARLEAFCKQVREEALAFARSFLPLEEDAEDAVSEALTRLASGKTRPKNFFRVLKQVALNRIARAKLTANIFAHPKAAQETDTVVVPRRYGSPRGVGPLPWGARDPLDAMLRQDEIEEAIHEVKTSRRRRGIRDRAWWKELMEYRELSRKQPARLHY